MDSKKDKTLREDVSPNDKLVLNSEWRFWMDKYDRGRDADQYHNSLELISTFDTVQGFWELFNAYPSIDQCGGIDSHMMRNSIKPIWEDPENGGFWVIRIKKDQAQEAWKELCLACVGEQFSVYLDEDDEVNGVTASVRQRDVVFRIWNKSNGSAKDRVLEGLKTIVINRFDKDQEPFYKACADHQNFDANLTQKLKNLKTKK